MEIPKPSQERSFQRFVHEVQPLYAGAEPGHDWDHIASCLANITELQKGNPDAISHTYDVARAAVLLHDLDRTKQMLDSQTLLKKFGFADPDIADITEAIRNHNKAKNRWTDPHHEVSQILYDADKMDTVRERFSKTKRLGEKVVATTDHDFIGYALMVRDSVTSPVAWKKITSELPTHLQVDISDPSVDLATAQAYEDTLREVWTEVNMPMKKTVAKYLLKATSNTALTRDILSSLTPVTREQLAGLSPKRRKWMNYVVNLQNYTEYFLQHMDELAKVAHDPLPDKQSLITNLNEKIFVYESLKRSIVDYPKAWERELDVFMDRTGAANEMHRNYSFYIEQSLPEKAPIGDEEIAKRKMYFRDLLGDRLKHIVHYSPSGSIESLKGGRRILDHHLAELYRNSDSSSILDIIDHTIDGNNADDAQGILRHFRQTGLRAVDRVNDALRTDRFVYSLIDGQSIEAPVQRLPYIYHLNADTLGDNGVHYFSPTHPQALHAMKMRHGYSNMPKILTDTIHFFTQGMYTPDQYYDLVTDMFATVCDEEDVDKSLLDYVLDHIVVNEDASLSRHPSGRYTSDEWLELDFGSRKDAEWKKANEIVGKINTYSKRVGIIPPLRPYAVCDKQIDIKADNITITANPLAA